MRTRQPQAFFLFGFSALALFATSSVSAAGHDDAQIVRIRSVQGDVRLSSGNGKKPDLGKPWVKAQADVPIEEGFSLATGEGRAEIEFEDSSVAFLAENSLLLFKTLRAKNGLPDTRLELLTGTATLFVRPLPKESFVLETPTGEMNFPKPEFLRVDSYLDGAVLTPQDEKGAVRQPNSELLHLAEGQKITFHDGLSSIDSPGPSHPASHDEWDEWVSTKVNERVAATDAAVKASGLTSPIPGLADLYEQGNFIPCEPYGTCWEPKERGTNQNPAQSAKQQQSPNAESTQGSSQRQPAKPALEEADQFPLVTECVSKETIPHLTIDYFRRETIWLTVCNYGNWIRREHRYVWVAGKGHHHPVHWIRVGNKEGFVPRHPNDERGKLPLNLEYGIFVRSKKAGQAFERIEYDPSQKLTLLTEPPKAFRNERLSALPPAARPEIHASFLADRASGAKGTVIAGGQPIGYDYKSKNFVLSHIDASGHASKPVAVASFSSRGGSSGTYGGHGAGSAGGAGNSGSHGGGGGSGASGSHGGGGGGSSGGGSGGGGGGTGQNGGWEKGSAEGFSRQKIAKR